jgi:hypothetical protein
MSVVSSYSQTVAMARSLLQDSFAVKALGEWDARDFAAEFQAGSRTQNNY